MIARSTKCFGGRLSSSTGQTHLQDIAAHIADLLSAARLVLLMDCVINTMYLTLACRCIAENSSVPQRGEREQLVPVVCFSPSIVHKAFRSVAGWHDGAILESRVCFNAVLAVS